MLEIQVITKEENDPMFCYYETIHGKRPRRYMCGWDYEKILKYVKEELYWMDVKEDTIIGFEFVNQYEHWRQSVMRPVTIKEQLQKLNYDDEVVIAINDFIVANHRVDYLLSVVDEREWGSYKVDEFKVRKNDILIKTYGEKVGK